MNDWHHHHFNYDEDERRKRHNPEEILTNAGLKAGMTFADLGSNDGFFTLPAARIVGPSGKVIALDVNEEALKRLKEKFDNEDINNYEIVEGAAEEADFKEDSIDFIFFGIVLHDFFDPIEVLKISQKAIKKDGIIYDYDWRKDSHSAGPPPEIRLDTNDVTKLAKKADLKVIDTKFLDKDFYEIILKK